MPLSVNYIYEFCQTLILKNQSVGIDNKQFQYHWDVNSFAFQNDLLGPFQAKNNGKTGMNTGLIEDETILQKLSPFTKPLSITIVSGNAPKPTDFIYRLALRVNGVDCYKINHGQIANVNADVIDPPSITDNRFYFVEYLGYYYILPHILPVSGITTADLDYISTPNKIRWAYTYDANNRKIYSASGLTGLDVIYGGVGYTTPTIAFSAPATGGVQATGTLTVVGGVITAVVMTNIGQGYAGLTPTFTITGSSTTPAAFGEPLVSVDSMWDDISQMEITKRMLKTLGVSIHDRDFENFGQSVIQTAN